MAAPYDHFAAGPHCGVRGSGQRCIGSRGDSPTVQGGIVSSTGVEIADVVVAAPGDHFTAGPDPGVTGSGRGRTGEARSHPAIIYRVVPAARIRDVECFIDAAPDNHFATRPYCHESIPARPYIHEAGRSPSVGGRIVSRAGVQIVRPITSTPDYHFTAGPQRRVAESRDRCI